MTSKITTTATYDPRWETEHCPVCRIPIRKHAGGPCFGLTTQCATCDNTGFVGPNIDFPTPCPEAHTRLDEVFERGREMAETAFEIDQKKAST